MTGFAEGHSAVLVWAIDISAAMIFLSFLFAFVRLVKGPTLPDRVVSVDLITSLAVAFAGLVALTADLSAFIDVAFALALVAFLATVAFAWYADRRTVQRDEGGMGRGEGER